MFYRTGIIYIGVLRWIHIIDVIYQLAHLQKISKKNRPVSYSLHFLSNHFIVATIMLDIIMYNTTYADVTITIVEWKDHL